MSYRRYRSLLIGVIGTLMVAEGVAQNAQNPPPNITCATGAGSSISYQNTCAYCMTSTSSTNGIYQQSMYFCSPACTNSDTTSGNGRVVVTCCNTDKCNAPSSGGLVSCYDSGVIKTGCKYCQKVVNTFPTNMVFTRSCNNNSCMAVNIGIIQTICCQTDLCNLAISMTTTWYAVIPAVILAMSSAVRM